MKRSLPGLGAIAALACIMLVACGASTNPDDSNASTSASAGTNDSSAGSAAPSSPMTETVKVTLGTLSVNAMHQWLMIATEEGFFEKHGVEIDVVTFAKTSDVIPAILGGSINFGLATPEQLFAAQDKQKSLKIVANEVANSPYVVYAMDPEITSLEALKGKTLGVSSVGGSVDYFAYKLLLNELGMKENTDYTIVNAGGISQRVNALINGQVDSEMVYPPGNNILEGAGANQVMRANESENFSNLVVNVLAADEAWYDKNRPAAEAFMQAYAESVTWLRDPANRSKAIEDVAKSMKVDNSQAESAYVEFIEKADAFPASGQVTAEQIEKTAANARAVELAAAPAADDLSWRYDNSLIAAAEESLQ